MSEYLSKKAVLEWLESEMSINKGHPDDIDIHWTLNRVSKKILSGAFDADNAEIQRLLAALMDTSLFIEDMAVSRIDDFYRLRDNARAMVAMIHSVLSTLCDVLEADRDDELYGDWTDERCPKCGANLLVNKVGDKWCSMVGCDYGLRETDSTVDESQVYGNDCRAGGVNFNQEGRT